MNIFDRIMLSLYTLAVAVVTLLVVGAYLNFPPGWGYEDLGLLLTRWELIPVAIYFFVFSVRFLVSGLRRDRPSKAAITHQGELGDVRIAVSAVRNLALRTAQNVRGVHTAKARVQLGEPGLQVSLEVSVAQGSHIPTLTTILQEEVKRNLEVSTGVTVLAVKVLVVEMSPAPKHRLQ
ncbi:MAG: alkaline shock response membrane anchor protein AmaP [Firmicutes bacterium]|nr:alkaline shock response membrane anchor protein AmaP [Dethiobacter sp.]MBS3889302.1 alkaline shock response membrane anchor protein AmaP [Bacillota bacterium]MBS4053154.1 alkaline shock response membrane anchor protein AmaP [Thermaerobacter sp.]